MSEASVSEMNSALDALNKATQVLLAANGGAIPIATYCEAFKTDVSVVNMRIARGTWQVGREILKPKGSKERYVDLDKVNQWARSQ